MTYIHYLSTIFTNPLISIKVMATFFLCRNLTLVVALWDNLFTMKNHLILVFITQYFYIFQFHAFRIRTNINI